MAMNGNDLSDVDIGMAIGLFSPAAAGVFTSLEALTKRLASAVRSIIIHGLHDGEIPEIPDLPDNVRLLLHRPTWSRPGFSPALWSAIMRTRQDLLHLHGLWMFQSAAVDAWRRRTGAPTVISPHGMLDAWSLRRSTWKKRLVGILYEYRNLHGAAAIHALNHEEAGHVRDFGLTNPLAVIPNGAELADLETPVAPPAWKQDDDRKVLLFLGRLHPKKGLVNLLRAWAQLRYGGEHILKRWQLVIAGWDEGGHVKELEQIVSQEGLKEHVRFPGALHGAEKHAALRHADAFILPSYSEGLPMSVLEAWAYGLPVFMTVACNLPAGFERGCAFEVETDASHIARVLVRVLDNEHLLARAGAQGRRLVAERYSWDTVARDMLSLYGWLLGRGEQPDCILQK